VALISKLRKPEVFKKHEEFLSSVSSEYQLDAKSCRGALYENIDSQLMIWITHCEHDQAILTDKLMRKPYFFRQHRNIATISAPVLVSPFL
jgi:hypothetical protein